MARRCIACSEAVDLLMEKCSCGEPVSTSISFCAGCGARTTRYRDRYDPVTNHLLGEECAHCKPNSFLPQWMTARGVTGPEAYPSKYKKTTDKDGRTVFVATDEFRQDTLDQFQNPKKATEEARLAAEKKRKNARREPLTEEEQRRIVAKMAEPIRKIQEEKAKERERARLAWLMP